MARIIAKAALTGLVGFLVLPAVIFLGVLALGYAFDPACGTPGASGGCEMGAAASAIASAIPGFMLFFLVSLLISVRRRRKAETRPREPS
ncbi:hypothetical protein [Nitratireductor sp. StC3]|uniref:hypothetical protein n=1 Tax=Nitratireductor sp. StC3 TaxID=2126741 RepID=UPI000D0DB538|nr:hypothetical protein [Nitratireductor sp. StC3]PSM17549.1 hypothetical protein C7T96_14595 [Nitratireductor sp. StC3]